MVTQKNGHSKAPSRLYRHLALNMWIGLMVTAAALSIGIFGYHYLESMSWVDSFMNASMILSGMGPASTLTTTAGKLFAGMYALFSGLTFIAIIVIMLSPVIHHFFRRMHLEIKDEENASKDA